MTKNIPVLFIHGCSRLAEKRKRSWENQTWRSAENADGNDTVPISVLRVEGVLSSECCCSSLVVFQVLCAKMVGETSSEGFLVFFSVLYRK